jgi:hypothetical protein
VRVRIQDGSDLSSSHWEQKWAMRAGFPKKCSKVKGRAGDHEDSAELSKTRVKHRPPQGLQAGRSARRVNRHA